MVCTVVISICACGGEPGNAAEDEVPERMGAENEVPEGAGDLDTSEIVDIHVTWPSTGGAPADMQMIEDAVNEITEKKIGVHVIFEAIAFQDLVSQQQLLISSGEQLDIPCMLWTGLDTWVNTESLTELEDLIPVYGKGIVERQGERAYGCVYDDHVYGVSVSGLGNCSGFLANSDILDKYGFDTADRVITIEELEEIFATVKEGEGDGFYCVARGAGFAYASGRYDNVGSSDYTGVIMLDGDHEKIVNLYETDSYKEYAYRVYDWAQKGYLSPDAATIEDAHQTLIASGNYLGGFSNTLVGVKMAYGSGGQIPITCLTLQEGYTKVSDLTDIMFGIASTCKTPEKAMAFLNELYTNAEICNLLENGIENVHFKVLEENEEGQRVITFADGVDMTNSGYYVSFGVWNIAATDMWAPVGLEELEERKVRAEYELSPAFGYVFDGRDYSTQLTALSAVYNEYEPIISCGAINPDEELPAYIEALKAAGIDEVIAANQEQYNKWLSQQ